MPKTELEQELENRTYFHDIDVKSNVEKNHENDLKMMSTEPVGSFFVRKSSTDGLYLLVLKTPAKQQYGSPQVISLQFRLEGSKLDTNKATKNYIDEFKPPATTNNMDNFISFFTTMTANLNVDTKLIPITDNNIKNKNINRNKTILEEIELLAKKTENKTDSQFVMLMYIVGKLMSQLKKEPQTLDIIKIFEELYKEHRNKGNDRKSFEDNLKKHEQLFKEINAILKNNDFPQKIDVSDLKERFNILDDLKVPNPQKENTRTAPVGVDSKRHSLIKGLDTYNKNSKELRQISMFNTLIKQINDQNINNQKKWVIPDGIPVPVRSTTKINDYLNLLGEYIFNGETNFETTTALQKLEDNFKELRKIFTTESVKDNKTTNKTTMPNSRK